MASAEKILEQMRRDPTDIRFADLRKVCEEYFGNPRQTSGSHLIFKMPWPGDPRINIQNSQGKAKAYQVRQALAAIDRLHQEQRQK